MIKNLIINGQKVPKDFIIEYEVPTQEWPYWVFHTDENSKLIATGNVSFEEVKDEIR
jgi:hypothetical protein